MGLEITLKKLIISILCVCWLLSAASFSASAGFEGEARAVIGADLTEDEIKTVYGIFGADRGSVKELSVSNAEERQYLEGMVEESLIGTRSISCVYMKILPQGHGLTVRTENLTWCEEEMFMSALVTAGIYDAEIIVAAPFEVSGTAALTGICKAYEDITGLSMEESAKQISTQELLTTSALAQEIGTHDAVSIVNEMKLILGETAKMSDEELKEQIEILAKEYGIELKDSQIQQLITLCRALEKLDSAELKEKVEHVQETVEKLSEAKDKVGGVMENVKNIVVKLSDFIRHVLDYFK